MAGRSPIFRVFYQDYHGGMAVSSAQPEQLAGGRIRALAEGLLAQPDNYIGIIDANELVLQLYQGEAPGRVQVELLYPEDRGMLRLELPLDEALALLEALPEQFDEALLPGAQFIA